ncbi:MAG: hypothetical protein ACP5VS_01380 [Desulfomonilaceae bacterium]
MGKPVNKLVLPESTVTPVAEFVDVAAHMLMMGLFVVYEGCFR